MASSDGLPVEISGLPEPGPVTDEILAAQVFNNGLRNLYTRFVGCDYLDNGDGLDHTLLVGVGEDGAGRLDYAGGVARLNGNVLRVDKDGVVIDGEGWAVDTGRITEHFARFTGSVLVAEPHHEATGRL